MKWLICLTECRMTRTFSLWIFPFLNSSFRVFINVFRRRASDFHRWIKCFELNFFIRKLFSTWSKQADRTMMISASQFGLYVTTPASCQNFLPKIPKLCHPILWLVILLRMHPHYSQSTHENAVPLCSTFPLIMVIGLSGVQFGL